MREVGQMGIAQIRKDHIFVRANGGSLTHGDGTIKHVEEELCWLRRSSSKEHVAVPRLAMLDTDTENVTATCFFRTSTSMVVRPTTLGRPKEQTFGYQSGFETELSAGGS